MSFKNKMLKMEQYRAGVITFNHNFGFMPERNPLSFANSDELRKIQNRQKKKKHG